MKIRFRTNLVSGIVFAGFSIVVWFLIPLQIESSGMSALVDAQFVPKLCTILLFIFSIILLIQSLVFKKDKSTEIDFTKEMKVILFFGILFIYLILITIIGFLISSLAFSTVSLLYLKCRKWTGYICTYAVVICLYLVFTMVLQVPLP
ncbi:MAG: tripartite tricarboxylate transporter TctB family protein [Vallitalea sp.]|jgi:hypothetical protein|nr:tripartite tricarboxylate transporter TctB family protein [Vallitalea sp.]